LDPACRHYAVARCPEEASGNPVAIRLTERSRRRILRFSAGRAEISLHAGGARRQAGRFPMPTSLLTYKTRAHLDTLVVTGSVIDIMSTYLADSKQLCGAGAECRFSFARGSAER
jgi:hypothetical protein